MPCHLPFRRPEKDYYRYHRSRQFPIDGALLNHVNESLKPQVCICIVSE
jgi:hypothetical protein